MAVRLLPLTRIISKKIISSPNPLVAVSLSEKIIKVGWITQFRNNYSTKYSEYRSKESNHHETGRRSQVSNHHMSRDLRLSEGEYNNESLQPERDTGDSYEHLGRNVSKKDKIKFLVNTLLGLKKSKETVYGALDAWVAWEQKFPLVSLRIALATLEKEQEWHRVIQVIKWILSKGQGNTMGVYRQLINALDMDHRAEEAHNFWMKKIGSDLHSVPWDLCTLMISIYYRNNMMQRLVKLFKGVESFDRIPPNKSVVQKVANAYEVLGLVEEKNNVLEKYADLFTETWRGHPKKSKKASKKEVKKSVEKNQTGPSCNQQNNAINAQTTSSDQQSTNDDPQVTSYNQQNNANDVIDQVRQLIHT